MIHIIIHNLNELLEKINEQKYDYSEFKFDDNFKYDEFEKYLKEHQGDLAGITFLGYCHENGFFKEQNLDKAFKCYSYAKDRGYSRAYCYLGIMLYQGNGVPKNQDLGLNNIYIAYADGDPKAMYFLALLQCYSREHNEYAYEKLLEESYKKGYHPAMYSALRLYIKRNKPEKCIIVSKLILETKDPLSILVKYLVDKDYISLDSSYFDFFYEYKYLNLYHCFVEDRNKEELPIKEDIEKLPYELSDFYKLLYLIEENDALQQMIDDLECFGLAGELEEADSLYHDAQEATDPAIQRTLYGCALANYKDAFESGADYVEDRIKEIEEILKKLN